MTRRNFIAANVAGALFAQPQRSRPNVLFIVADDMNDYGFLEAYPGVKTPYLDRFRKQAITFERSYCASPACVPSRGAFLSGLYPHNTGSYFNGSDPWGKPPFTSTQSMMENFRAGGYETYGQGKLTHAPVPPDRLKEMWDNEPHGGGFGPWPPKEDQVRGQFWGHTAWTGPDTDFPDVKNADFCIDFLSRKHEKPFFLMYGLWRPHTPFTAPKRFFEMYDPASIRIPPPGFRENDLDDVPPRGHELAKVWGERFEDAGLKNPKGWREFMHAYFACTSFADWSAGRVIEALDRGPYARETIVVYTTDNGYHCGEKDHWEKTTLWEQAALTPMAIRMPGNRNANKRCPRTVNLIDLYPTFVDLCGLKPPAHALDGKSLRPLLDNPSSKWDRPALTTYGERHASVRDERYRYIRYPDGSEELYDHSSDRHEWTNIASKEETSSVKNRLSKFVPAEWARSLGGRLG